MDDIIKYDVRTYVEELIKKEFSSKNRELSYGIIRRSLIEN
jgi:hypothetical protein